MRLRPGPRPEESSRKVFPFKNIPIHIVLDTAGALFGGLTTSVFHIYVLVMGNRGRVCFRRCAIRKLRFLLKNNTHQKEIQTIVNVSLIR